MEKIEVRIMIASMVISKEFKEDKCGNGIKEAYDFISEEVKKYNDITRIEIQKYIYNDCDLLIQSNIKYYYEW